MKFIILMAALSYSSLSFAGTWGIIGGMNINISDNKKSGQLSGDLESGTGFQIGTLYSINFDSFRLRTLGQFRSYRGENSVVGQDLQFSTISLAFPILFEKEVHKFVRLFVGPDFAFRIRDNALRNESPVNAEYNDFYYGVMTGASFRVTKRLYFDVFYNYTISDLARDLRLQSAGVQLITYFGKH